MNIKGNDTIESFASTRFFQQYWDCIIGYHSGNKLSTKFGNFRISILRHIQSLFQVPVVGSSVLLADKFGRRPLLLVKISKNSIHPK